MKCTRRFCKSKRLYFGDHPDTATTYSNVGSVLCGKRDYDGALIMYKKAMAIQEAVLGDHPDTTATYVNMRSVLPYISNSQYMSVQAFGRAAVKQVAQDGITDFLQNIEFQAIDDEYSCSSTASLPTTPLATKSQKPTPKQSLKIRMFHGGLSDGGWSKNCMIK